MLLNKGGGGSTQDNKLAPSVKALDPLRKWFLFSEGKFRLKKKVKRVGEHGVSVV